MKTKWVAKKILTAVYRQKAIAALILVFAVMPLVNTSFFTVYNMVDMLKSASVYITIGCGVTVVVISGACDLSVGGIMCLAGIITVKMMGKYPLFICIIFALLMGVLVGAVNGFFVVRQKSEAFVITLGMGALLKGVAQQLTDAHPIAGTNKAFFEFGTGSFLGLPNITVMMFLILITTCCLLRFTQFGRNCYAVGGDYDVAEYSGIPALRTKWLAFVISGFLAALGGVLLTARLNTGASTYGDTTALLVNCGTVLGGTSFAGGIGNAWKTALGLLLFTVLESALGMGSLNAYAKELVIGIIIAVIIGIDSYDQKRKAEMV
ncbi:ABC transporter permease [Lacrimispora sp. NSJ-141]|uniref:ABC transporter permease n=1 Tax=Lientehia hominis TaxID=2897778 RepID=A0AAP2W999_9FIRM|nr:ABC transporter permease [Lientehia hominis]MCD2493031.1 ABC transporter permease [Lientehia hominis]